MLAEAISKEYFNWVKENHKFYNLKSTTAEIQTPYVDSFGDSISFSITNDKDTFKLTDLGYTIWNLEAHGVNVTKKNNLRTQLLESIINFEGAKIEGDKEIVKESTKSNLGQSIHDMAQMLLRLSDLAVTHKQNVKSLFEQDVEEYFFEHKETFNFFPSFSVQGKSNLLHRFDYLFFRQKSEFKLVRVQNTIAKSTVDSILTSWLDTSQYRNNRFAEASQLDIIVNGDNYDSINEEYLNALNEYNIGVINFNNKQDLVETLS